jgi:hypothetical protein
MKKHYISLAILMVAAAILNPQSVWSAAGKEAEGSEVISEVTLSGTQLRKLHSSIVGQEYDIHICLPSGYGSSSKTYPVLYLLDADIVFGIVSQMYRILEWGSSEWGAEVERMIIVGIGYPGGYREFTYGRSR